MKNLIVVGDSFCASPGWPQELARLLDLNLIVAGFPGQHWWSYKNFLDNLLPEQFVHTELMVFVHTFTQRIAHLNEELAKIDLTNLDSSNEIEQAAKLYYKHIHNDDFHDWAQIQWFKEVKEKYSTRFKTIHLHAFPWTRQYKQYLSGIQVRPSLSSISLDEIGREEFVLYADSRPNHFSKNNNLELAKQLSKFINSYHIAEEQLDTSKFDLKTTKWIEENN